MGQPPWHPSFDSPVERVLRVFQSHVLSYLLTFRNSPEEVNSKIVELEKFLAMSSFNPLRGQMKTHGQNLKEIGCLTLDSQSSAPSLNHRSFWQPPRASGWGPHLLTLPWHSCQVATGKGQHVMPLFSPILPIPFAQQSKSQCPTAVLSLCSPRSPSQIVRPPLSLPTTHHHDERLCLPVSAVPFFLAFSEWPSGKSNPSSFPYRKENLPQWTQPLFGCPWHAKGRTMLLQDAGFSPRSFVHTLLTRWGIPLSG